MNLWEVADLLEKSITIKYYPPRKVFSVSFDRGEILEGGMLISASGQGKTIDGAVKEYEQTISERKIVFNAMQPERQEYKIPSLRKGV